MVHDRGDGVFWIWKSRHRIGGPAVSPNVFVAVNARPSIRRRDQRDR